MEKLIAKAENLTKIYKLAAEEIFAVNDVDLEIHQGDLVSITGPSGSGKTTLLDILGCLDSLTSGQLEIMGTEVSGIAEDKLVNIRRKNIGFVFQDFSLVPSLTAFENVELARHFARRNMNTNKSQQLLDMVGLGARANHLPRQLSGGEKQRVAIARALSVDPAFLIADEPTGHLDTSNTQQIMELLRKLNDEGMTVIIATHDMNIAEQTKRQIMLKDGKIV